MLIGDPAADALRDYFSKGRNELLAGKKSEAVFVNHDGGRLTERSVQKLLAKYAAAAGIDGRGQRRGRRHAIAGPMPDGGVAPSLAQDPRGSARHLLAMSKSRSR